MINAIYNAVLSGKRRDIQALVQSALDGGVSAETILSDGLIAAMNEVGERFKDGKVYIPEVMLAGKTMSMAAELLKPHLVTGSPSASVRVVLGTVQGDQHDIGKSLVKMMMEGQGMVVIDLGTNVPPARFVKTAIEENCAVIACSALLTTTMPMMADVVKEAEAAGIRDKVKIMVGGAPVTAEFAARIGADAYAEDAKSAADTALSLAGMSA